MRELNQKIYEIAEMESDEDSVRIGQLITDNIIEEGFDEIEAAKAREEAKMVIQEGREMIYGRAKEDIQPVAAGNQNEKLKQAFKSTGEKTRTGIQSPNLAAAKGKTNPKVKVTNKSASKAGVKKVAAKKTAAKKSSNSSMLILLLIIAAGVAYYFTMMNE